MKGSIGVYDSGLGGLTVMRDLRALLPVYDYVFFGDERNFPYGEKSIEELRRIAQNALTFLFEKKGCELVLIACNTVSANLYDELVLWVESTFPGRHLVGIVKETVAVLPHNSHYTFFGTPRTISSGEYDKEVREQFSDATTLGVPLSKLAGYIEKKEDPFPYLSSVNESVTIPAGSTCVLVCTHYGLAEEEFRRAFPTCENIIRQEHIVAEHIRDTLSKDAALRGELSYGGTCAIYTSSRTDVFEGFAHEWFPDVAVEELKD